LECPATAQLGLWDPLERATTGTSFPVQNSGAVIHRITGILYVLPRFVFGDPGVPPSTDVGGIVGLYANMHVLCRVGLMKQRAEVNVTTGVESLLTWNPLRGSFDPSGGLYEGDYTDGRWMRTWERSWDPKYTLGYQFTNPACCPIVSGTITGASPGVTTGEIGTECVVCSPEEAPFYGASTPFGAGPFLDAHVEFPSYKAIRIDVRTKLRMEETDRLDLWVGWYNSHVVGTDPLPQPRLFTKGDIKALVSHP
jgi:hypothetical protein